MQRLRLNKVARHCFVPSVLLALGAVITWYNQVRPHPATDVLLAVLDRLQNPGLLSRDLVAGSANLSFTAYDEISLLVARLCTSSLWFALQLQSFACTVAEAAGLYILASSFKLSRAQSLLTVFSILLIANAIFRNNPFLLAGELTPQVFALALTILAVGLLGERRTVAAGLVGGVALLYDVRMAAPFWLLTIAAFVRMRSNRALLKPLLWTFLVFALLLANLAQLQPVPSQTEPAWTRISGAIATIDRQRLPWQWIASWSWLNVGLFLVFTFGTAVSWFFLWTRADRLLRFYLLGLPIFGLLSLPLTLIFVDGGRVSFFVRSAFPAWAAFDAYCCLLLGIAALWILIRVHRFSFILFCASVFAVVCFLAPLLLDKAKSQMPDKQETAEVAKWAEEETWAGSVFLFPDAGQASYPSTFRAVSQRALWVDWSSGFQVNSSQTLADTWWRRWQDTMSKPWTNTRWKPLLVLPIDYYVLQRQHQLAEVAPSFSTAHLVVYDADVLRSHRRS